LLPAASAIDEQPQIFRQRRAGDAPHAGEPVGDRAAIEPAEMVDVDQRSGTALQPPDELVPLGLRPAGAVEQHGRRAAGGDGGGGGVDVAGEQPDLDPGPQQPVRRRPAAVEREHPLPRRPRGGGRQQLDRTLGPALAELGRDMDDRRIGGRKVIGT
jgi:hypothetical protein